MVRSLLLNNSGINETESLPGDRDVHLWFLRLGEVSELWLQSLGRDLLPDHEMDKSRRFHFTRDCTRFLMTRILLRTTLSRYHDVSPRDWKFSANPFGRPSIATSHGKHRFDFNISHTSNLIVLAAVQNLQIGIDIEQHRLLTTQLEIAERFFGPVEVNDLRRLPSHLRSRRFLEYWTLKEAYIKARGRGLSIPLDSVAFSLTPGRIDFIIDADQGDANPWRFLQFDVFDDHIGALCIGSPPAATLRLTAREVIPDQEEQSFDLGISRQSD